LDRVFLFDALQKHQKFLYFFFDTVFSNEISTDIFKNFRSDLYENSSPFWTKLNYNVEHFTGDK
jgi:lipopolysaccharide biosynthesis glycosyltransferase